MNSHAIKTGCASEAPIGRGTNKQELDSEMKGNSTSISCGKVTLKGEGGGHGSMSSGWLYLLLLQEYSRRKASCRLGDRSREQPDHMAPVSVHCTAAENQLEAEPQTEGHPEVVTEQGGAVRLCNACCVLGSAQCCSY